MKKYVILAIAVGFLLTSGFVMAKHPGDSLTTNAQSSEVASGAGGALPETVTSGVATPVNLTLFKNYRSANYVAAGIGVRNTGRGTISLRLPDNATLINAWLYWKILNTTAGIHDNEITVNRVRVTGQLIGQGPSPCWAGTGFTYRANIDPLIPPTSNGQYMGFDIGGMMTSIIDGGSPWAPNGFSLPAAEDVELVIVFNDPLNPTSTVTIFDGYDMQSGITTFNVPPMTNMYSSSIGDGQVVGVIPYTKSVNYANPPQAVSPLQQVTLNGKDPSITSRATYQGSLSDTDTFILPTVAVPGATLTWNLANDCVAYDALVFSSATNVP